MIETLSNIDHEIFLWFNGHTGAYADSFFWLYSGKLIWIGLYAAIFVAIVRRFGWRTTLGILLATAFIIALTDQICGNFVRNAFERLRPSNLSNPFSQSVHIVNGYRGGAYGFPSCHAANTFALATFIMLLFRRRTLTIAMYLWAVVTACSRLVLGVHYPGDLFVGAIVGSLVSAMTYYTARTVYCRYFSWREGFGDEAHPERVSECRRLIIVVMVATVGVMAVLAAIG